MIRNVKEDEMSQGTHAYKTATSLFAACTQAVDAPIPERSPEEFGVGKHGLVRSVPLMRKAVKDGFAKQWTPPGKAAYKFTYEFSCKRAGD